MYSIKGIKYLLYLIGYDFLSIMTISGNGQCSWKEHTQKYSRGCQKKRIKAFPFVQDICTEVYKGSFVEKTLQRCLVFNFKSYTTLLPQIINLKHMWGLNEATSPIL